MDTSDQEIADGIAGALNAKPKGKKPPRAGMGRKKGVPNKITANIKAAIIEAFDKAGGAEYLLQIAKTDPRTFCALVGKVIPLQVSGDPDNPISLKGRIEIAIIDPAR